MADVISEREQRLLDAVKWYVDAPNGELSKSRENLETAIAAYDPPKREIDWATKIAAQLWCEPEHSAKEVDCDFAFSIAAALRKAKAEAFRECAKHAGLPVGGLFQGDYAVQKVKNDIARWCEARASEIDALKKGNNN